MTAMRMVDDLDIYLVARMVQWMVALMAVTPVIMQAEGATLSESSTVLQAHILGMYIPSFCTGSVVKRFGVWCVVWSGLSMIVISAVGLLFFWPGVFAAKLVCLTVVGIGWKYLSPASLRTSPSPRIQNVIFF